MALGRRTRTSGGTATPQQQISFTRQSSNKITKPGAAKSPSDKKKKATALDAAIATTDIDLPSSLPTIDLSSDINPDTPASKPAKRSLRAKTPPSATTSSTAQIPDSPSLPHRQHHQTEPTVSVPKQQDGPNDKDSQARLLPSKRIKQYWQTKEQARRAPRVHQDTVSLHEKILREFDLSSQYGPCIGLTRERRWRRADKLGLEPPVEVLAVILKEGVGSGIATERAYMDRLTGHLL